MLPGGLCNPAHKGTMITPDSSYDWRSFGEHVTAHPCSGWAALMPDYYAPQ